MMFPSIDNPASCAIGALISYLHAKNINSAEMNRELCAAVYNQNERVRIMGNTSNILCTHSTEV
jgi:hypothetical protein